MKRAPLLVEIGVEELPALPLLKILDEIEKSWGSLLKEYRLESDFKFEYTPRRLSIISPNFPLKQEDRVVEFFGPPLNIAYKDNQPTKAALGFAKKCGVEIDNLTTTTKGNSEVLYYKKEEKGIESKELLGEIVYRWLKSMNFGKAMRWGDLKDEFIRPIRWIVALLDDEVVDIELFKVRANNTTRVHRMNQKPLREVNFSNYEKTLEDGNVILSAKNREKKVVDGIKEIEKEKSVEVEIDKELLKEVVAITEYPTSLIGSFDKKFLELPKEVIITSMKEHQRYFAVFKDGSLTNNFIVVSNAVTNDFSKIIAGNERVLRARLEDALFFYKNDLKRGLSTKGLEQVQFIDGLGSLKDKIDREDKIIEILYELYKDRLEKEYPNKDIKRLLKRAIELAKADLLSEMVYEFTELQGLMGYYYAKALGEDELVYSAIKEQYLPTGDKSPLPSSLFSTLVAMAIKLDTLFGLFSAGKIPTGSKDPFALRRAVNGIIRMIISNDIDFELEEIFKLLKPLYKEFDEKQLKEFIFERIYKFANVNPSIVTAVLSSNDTNINSIFKKIKALDEIVKEKNSKELFSTFKRVANISKDINLNQELRVDENLFEKDEEKELYKRFLEVKHNSYSSYKE
ncbi:MAG: glycine--tRNA ligase subunit beta, partial [Epsilonproteobacteria bacterium]|nr:glycine--tRNA ligase subunit beta [Campylobacterota bacterium]